MTPNWPSTTSLHLLARLDSLWQSPIRIKKMGVMKSIMSALQLMPASAFFVNQQVGLDKLLDSLGRLRVNKNAPQFLRRRRSARPKALAAVLPHAVDNAVDCITYSRHTAPTKNGAKSHPVKSFQNAAPAADLSCLRNFMDPCLISTCSTLEYRS